MAAEEPSIAQQIACVKREIALRLRCYPRWVKATKMTEAEASKEVAAMTAALHSLMRIEQAEAAAGRLL